MLLRRVRTIVSHAHCPDGIAAALILRGALPHAEVVFIEHDTPEQTSLPATAGMIFCDLVPSVERSAEFVEAGAIVLDHHRGAREVVAAFGERGVFADESEEPGVCGATLAHREVWCALREDEQEVRRFAELAGVRDCWQTHHPDWEEAAAQASALVFFGYDELAKQIPIGAPPCLSESQLAVGRILHAKQMRAARDTAERKLYRLRPDVAVFNDRGGLLSDVAAVALEADRQLCLVCGFHYKVTSDGAMRLVCSMRSRAGEIDVAAIAKANGGGGHTSAAGFVMRVSRASPSPLGALERTVASHLHQPSAE